MFAKFCREPRRRVRGCSSEEGPAQGPRAGYHQNEHYPHTSASFSSTGYQLPLCDIVIRKEPERLACFSPAISQSVGTVSGGSTPMWFLCEGPAMDLQCCQTDQLLNCRVAWEFSYGCTAWSQITRPREHYGSNTGDNCVLAWTPCHYASPYHWALRTR
jgi:hypothetical protein